MHGFLELTLIIFVIAGYCKEVRQLKGCYRKFSSFILLFLTAIEIMKILVRAGKIL